MCFQPCLLLQQKPQVAPERVLQSNNLSEPHLKLSVASLVGEHPALITSFSLEGAHQTAREPGTIISSDFELNQLPDTFVVHVLLHTKGSQLGGSPGALTPGLHPCAQHGLSVLVICCSSNPQLGEVPVEMVFFFQIQQLFFF